MKETTFENAKVGDTVYILNDETPYKIEDVVVIHDYPIKLKDKTGEKRSFGLDGLEHCLGPQTLYWQKTMVEAPERPKRKVTKTVVRYVNIYQEMEDTFLNEEVAQQRVLDNRIACVKLTGTYEDYE